MKELALFKRDHGIAVFENAMRAFQNFIIPFLITLIPALKSGKANGLWVTAVLFLAFMGLSIIFSLLSWLFKTYRIEDGVFSLRSGILIKKHRKIPLSSIVTFHGMQTLTQRLFRVYTIKLDTGSSLLKGTEIKLVVSAHEFNRIKEALISEKQDKRLSPEAMASLSDRTDKKDTEDIGKLMDTQLYAVYRCKAMDIVKMGLTSNAIFAGLALILSIFQFVSQIMEENPNELLNHIEQFIRGTPLRTSLELLLLVIMVLLVYTFFSLVVSAITNLIKYYGFKVLKEGSTLVIEYGLLKKNRFSINEDRIQVLYFEQSFLRQILGYVQIHIESIGYGNEKGEEALLIPLVRLKEADDILSRILTDYLSPPPLAGAPRRSLWLFAAGSLFFPLLLILSITIFYQHGYISLSLIPFFLLSGILQFRNSGISRNPGRLYLGYGGYKRCVAHIRKDGVQAVIKKATPIQRVAGLLTLLISIQGRTFGKMLGVKHLDQANLIGSDLLF